MVNRDPIKQFRDEWGCFSNFYPAPIGIDGERYPTVEHAYQACKAHRSDIAARALIRNAVTPAEAKRFGRKVTLREGWEENKLDYMDILVTMKFLTPRLQAVLVRSAPRLLYEGNTHHDTFWGVDLYTGQGQNHLGRILMRLRNRLVESPELRVEVP